jgi:hypothetical protein
MHNPPGNSNGTSSSLRALPAGIWVLGFGSLFMDISSELVYSLLPVFMTTVLGTSMITVGIVEGIAEATAAAAGAVFAALAMAGLAVNGNKSRAVSP